MPAPSVAIVILNWNGKKYLQQFLPSVLASTYSPLRVIVADNASSDDSLLFLKTEFPSVETIILPENFGFAKGYNEALKQVQSDYYLLLNSDVEVTPGWIDPMINLLESDTAYAACQPKILSYHRKEYFEYAGAVGGWLDLFGYPFARGRVFDVCEKDEGQFNEAAKVFWSSGAAMLIRSHCFHEVGGFDDYFFAHQEEIDLCWRLQRSGYHLWCEPSSVVYHVGGGTLPRGNSRKTFLNFRNNQILLAKNLPLSESIWKIPFRLLLDQVSAVKGLAGGDLGYFIAIFKSHLAFFDWVLMRGKKRSSIPRRRLAGMDGVFRGNVVWEHFGRGRKRFREIVRGEEQMNKEQGTRNR